VPLAEEATVLHRPHIFVASRWIAIRNSAEDSTGDHRSNPQRYPFPDECWTDNSKMRRGRARLDRTRVGRSGEATGPFGMMGCDFQASAAWFTSALNSQGRRVAAGTMRGASSGRFLDQSSPPVSRQAGPDTRRQARS
jgi:hypothetical protein